MNFIFGVTTFLAPVAIVALSFYVSRRTKKISHGVILGVVGLSVFFSFSTYGPRYELESAKLPEAPYKKDVESSGDFIPYDDRWDRFDDVVVDHEERQKI